MNEDRFNRIAALKPATKRAGVEPRGYVPATPEGADDLARLLGATLQETRHGEHLSVRRWFSDASPGDVTMAALRLLAPDAPDEAADQNNWLFLDTETTGLAGGTGTYAFLIGIAWWDAGGLEVEQFFMRDHCDEHSVLGT
ncbi:MAG: ribonuclease H-like domain-containing protein, partial [Candidatus Acidiferrales bacterium]